MDWKYWGFKENPFSTTPINQDTLELFVGHNKQVETCNSSLVYIASGLWSGGRIDGQSVCR